MHGLAGIRAINQWAASRECAAIVNSAKSAGVKYEGHLPNGHGVQAHSAGPLFPFIHYQKTRDDALVDYIMIGAVTVRVPSYAMAEQLVAEARQIKANAAAYSATVQPLDECLASAARLHGYAVERFREEV